MDSELLQKVYAAQLLILGRLIKLEKAERGVHTSSDCADDAAREIQRFLETWPRSAR